MIVAAWDNVFGRGQPPHNPDRLAGLVGPTDTELPGLHLPGLEVA